MGTYICRLLQASMLLASDVPRPEMPQRPKASAVDFPSGRQSRARASEAKEEGEESGFQRISGCWRERLQGVGSFDKELRDEAEGQQGQEPMAHV